MLLKKLCGDVRLLSNVKQTKSYFIGAANSVRLQRLSGLDAGVELERFHSNSFNKYIIRKNAYIKTHDSVLCSPTSRSATP